MLRLQRISSVRTLTLNRQISSAVKENDVIHGFTVERVVPVPDFNANAIYLKHNLTGAHHLHVDRNDSNNLFGVMFKTIPQDSTGVPHILEHVTLCGSQKYPVRDPFFKMLNRSLSTFMNAYTSNDFTLYPFSSRDQKDFKNLMSVYLDSTFAPKLDYLDFRQEGWRLEHQDPNDSKTPLTLKGVVYNEMKGVYSDPDNFYYTKLMQSLYPGLTYQYSYGGDPVSIPDLTHNDLRQFYFTYYHPSNAKFFTYGNFSLENHLEQIDSVIQKFDKKAIKTSIGKLQEFPEPQEIKISGPFDPNLEPHSQISHSYLTNPIKNTYETFCMRVLSALLVDGPRSIFHKKLIDSQIGTKFTHGTGYNGDYDRSFFSVGVSGLNPKFEQKFEDKVMKTFIELEEHGFPNKQEQINAKLSQVELNLRYQKENVGLDILFHLCSIWNAGGDPIENLKMSEHISRLKEDLKNERFFENKIRKYFLENNHQLKFVVEPDSEYNLKLEKKEKEKLENMIDVLKEEDKEKIYKEGLELLKNQNTPQDTSCLPTIKIDEITSTIDKDTGIEKSIPQFPKTRVYWNQQDTNSLTFVQANISVPIPDELKIYLPLFCKALPYLGPKDKDRNEYLQDLEIYTGGIQLSPTVIFHPKDPQSYLDTITLSSYCLNNNIDRMFELISETLLNPNLTEETHLMNLIRMISSNLFGELVGAGHIFAMNYASSQLGKPHSLRETYSGITQMSFIEKLTSEQLPIIISNLQKIGEILKNNNSLKVSMTSNKEGLELSQKPLEKFLKNFPKTTDFPAYQKDKFESKGEKTHFDADFQISHTSTCIQTVPFTDPKAPVLAVLGELMTSSYLHREIREQNGAYGGGARYHFNSGIFSFYSYRDANADKTIDTYTKSIDWVLTNQFTDTALTESIISTLSTLLKPVEPGRKGLDTFFRDLTFEMKEDFRERLLKVTRSDVLEVAEKYLKNQKHSSVVIGPPSDTFLENGWINKKKEETK